MKFTPLCVLFLILAVMVVPVGAQIDARMLRMPAVSQSEIAFIYAGDIWVVSKEGGTANRLSSPAGEESFPRFSPDGSLIGYMANYDGNGDIYVIPRTGGLPKRVTHHPADDRLLGWSPDGTRLLTASSAESGRQRFRQLFTISKDGGLPEKLPVPFGEFGSLSPDGKTLAYIPVSRDYRTWKRYRGGMAPDIWFFNLETMESENVTRSNANDSHPMWTEKILYFLSDRGPEERYNLWAYDLKKKTFRQITKFEDDDVHFPSIGPSDIVYEAGGRLYLMDLKSEKSKPVEVKVVTDQRTLKPKIESVARMIAAASISPSGKRVAFEARGEVFTVPAEHGVIRNLTRDSGVAERSPSWSPDGKHIAYWSDRSGEYELTLRNGDGSGEEEKLTNLGPGFRYSLFWSPDSKKLAFIDQAMKIHYFDIDKKTVTEIGKGLYMMHGALAGFQVSWSSDSRWIAYSKGLENRINAVFLYDTENGVGHQVTSGYYDDSNPVFDPDGKYLYFLTNRHFSPTYSTFDNSWVYNNSIQIAAVPLRADVMSPLEPRNDEETGSEGQKGKQEEKKEKPAEKPAENGEKPAAENGGETNDGQPSPGEGEAEQAEKGSKEEKPADDAKKKSLEISLDGFENRVVILPPAPGNYVGLAAVSGKVVFVRMPRSGSDNGAKSELAFYDLKDRDEKSIISDIRGFEISADGKKVLVSQNGSFGIINLAPKQAVKDRLRTSELQMSVDPKVEWRQILNDAWRLERDYFYDASMHGVDWNKVRTHYGKLLEDAVTRWDVNFVLGEMIGELNASHTYRGGGDEERGARSQTGLLGIDWEVHEGAYRIKRILKGASWDSEARSPLDRPGLKVSEGEYILAVNGIELGVSTDPYAAFQGLANETVLLTVNDKPSREGARDILVETITDESRLRHLEWIEANRKRVDEASGGRLGYIYVRSTGIDGQNELVRQFYSQYQKDGLIIDERFNSGGQIPDRFIELLNRKPLSYWAVRDGKDWQWPPVAHFGPKVMLINGWSGSGGDAFPFYFKESKLGPLVGTATWGGLIGISGVPGLIDGGGVTVPTFRMYSVDGVWFPEGQGVKPDIEVIEDPTEMAKGTDPQLERAIKEALKLADQNGNSAPSRPAYENRTPAGSR